MRAVRRTPLAWAPEKQPRSTGSDALFAYCDTNSTRRATAHNTRFSPNCHCFVQHCSLAANLFLVSWVVRLTGSILERIPLVTSLFGAFEDIARLFSQDVDHQLGQVVAVDVNDMRLVGFVMQQDA